MVSPELHDILRSAYFIRGFNFCVSNLCQKLVVSRIFLISKSFFLYTFSANYNGRTCSQIFEVKVPSDVKTPLNKLGRINLQPNPFKISTKIILPNVAENVSYTISNGIGQVVKFGTIPADNTLEITRDNLPAGLYFLKLNKVSLSNNTTKMLIAD